MKGENLNYKKLKWKQNKNGEYRSDISIKGLFGIRFICKKGCNDKFYYKYIINGKHHGGYLGFECSSIKNAKQLCEEKYEEICDKIINKLMEDEF